MQMFEETLEEKLYTLSDFVQSLRIESDSNFRSKKKISFHSALRIAETSLRRGQVAFF